MMAACYVVGTICGTASIERFGRRPMMLGFTSANMSCLVMYVIFAALQPAVNALRYGCLVTLLVYGFTYGYPISDHEKCTLFFLFFSFGVGPITWFISAELVPQRHRSLVQSFCYAFNQIMATILSFITLPIYDKLNAYTFLILFVVPAVFCLIYLFRNLPETKGKEIHEIVRQLKSSTRRGDRQRISVINGTIPTVPSITTIKQQQLKQ